jgi:hypothetical protein
VLQFLLLFNLIVMKKNYQYKIVQLIICCLLLSGCDKYLDITPKGRRLLSTVEDFDLWLNNAALYSSPGQPRNALNYLGDNVDIAGVTTPAVTVTDLVYTWAPQFHLNQSEPPIFWGEHYAKINLFNAVLAGIDEATDGTNAKRKSLKAEALLGRAFEYFYLVNEYGKPYDATTASVDLAVPFVTSDDVSEVVPPRSTVAEIHQHIIDDINAAIANLPADNSPNRLRGSVGAAYSVLARVYLYMRNYPEARKNAELALLNSRTEMINYNGTLPATPLISTHPDVIYGRVAISQYPVTLDFVRSYTSNDLRLRRLFTSTDNYQFATRSSASFSPPSMFAYPSLYYTNSGTSFAEMKLIAAEGAARSNDLAAALQHLDDVRKARFPTASYVKYTSAVQEDVLKEVLTERSQELPFNGLRWFDMRRFDKENRMGIVTRYNQQGVEIASLPVHSSKYTLQIPSVVLSFNPGMPQNP